jgi:hypothetical protein
VRRLMGATDRPLLALLLVQALACARQLSLWLVEAAAVGPEAQAAEAVAAALGLVRSQPDPSPHELLCSLTHLAITRTAARAASAADATLRVLVHGLCTVWALSLTRTQPYHPRKTGAAATLTLDDVTPTPDLCHLTPGGAQPAAAGHARRGARAPVPGRSAVVVLRGPARRRRRLQRQRLLLLCLHGGDGGESVVVLCAAGARAMGAGANIEHALPIIHMYREFGEMGLPAMKSLRTVTLRFGTGRRKMALERYGLIPNFRIL